MFSTCADIGGDNPSGSVSYTGGGSSPLAGLTLVAGGNGVDIPQSRHSGGTEGFYLAYHQETSDFSLSTEVTSSATNGSNFNNAGAMLRAGTGSSSTAYYYAYILPPTSSGPGSIAVSYLSASGGTPTTLALVPESSATTPGSSGSAATCSTGGTGTCYLAIERRTAPDGSVHLESYWGSDGTHWNSVNGSAVTLPSSSPLYDAGYAGIAATSDSSGNSSTATFASVTLTNSPIFDSFPAECPPSEECVPVGSGVQGLQWASPSNSWGSSPWTVSGSGTGLVNGATSDL